MSTVTKFTFDLDFDAPEEPEVAVEEVEEEEPEEIIPTFSEEELEQARAEGFEAGKEEGRREAADATEQKLLETIDTACAKLAEIYNTQTEANRDIAREMITVSTAIAKKMFPDLNARNALGEVERVVQETLKAVTEEPRIQIMVNPELREPLSERLGTMTHRAGFEGKVFINPDPSMALGDCRIEWSNGAAVRDGEELWEMIDKIIEQNLHDPVELDEEEDVGANNEDMTPLQSEADYPPSEDNAAMDAGTAPPEDAAEAETEAEAGEPETAEADMNDAAASEAEMSEAEAPAELDAGETPSWQAAVGESKDTAADAAPETEPEAAAAPGEADAADNSDAPQTDEEEHSFTPSIDTDEDPQESENIAPEQDVSEQEREAPIPHVDDFDPPAESDGGEDGDTRASLAPVSDPDPVSPETQAAILDAQSAMADDEDNDDRNPSGG